LVQPAAVIEGDAVMGLYYAGIGW